MKLKRKKIGDRSYNLINVATGEAIAHAAQTGEHGRDNYPWEWSMLDDRIFGKLDYTTGRSTESLKEAIDYVESGATSFGVLKPVGKVSAYDIKEGDVFSYQRYRYRATQDAYGEFNAYIPANNYKGELSEVLIPHGNEVTLYKVESY